MSTKPRATELDFLGVRCRTKSTTLNNNHPFLTASSQPSPPAPPPAPGVDGAWSSPYTSPGNNPLLTIIFDGSVSVYDVPPEKARDIIRLAASLDSPTAGASSTAESAVAPRPPTSGICHNHAPNGDLPIAMRRSLHRFFEKRKGR